MKHGPLTMADIRIDGDLKAAPELLGAAATLALGAPTRVYGVNVTRADGSVNVVLVLPNRAVPLLAAMAAFTDAYNREASP